MNKKKIISIIVLIILVLVVILSILYLPGWLKCRNYRVYESIMASKNTELCSCVKYPEDQKMCQDEIVAFLEYSEEDRQNDIRECEIIPIPEMREACLGVVGAGENN